MPDSEIRPPLEYEVTGEIGHPHWELIFEYVLRQCGYLVDFHTVYVMVDNRELANHKRRDPSLPHWPAAARWWHSRLKLIGPHKEKTELLLFPISAATGLHHVHPTWAGTFVLAALVAMFPGINFVLLDSDCLPVTLFEVDGGFLGAISSTFRKWHSKDAPTAGFRTISHRSTGCVHTASCLQHSNGARGSCGY